MNTALPILLALVGFGSCFSFTQTPTSPKSEPQSPLASYIDGLRGHRINSAAAEFTRTCDVKLDEAAHRFAFANDDAGTWKMVASLPKAYDNLEMDLVGTAEVWKNSAGAVVEEWQVALDVGGFERTFFCFDSAGRLKAIDSTNYQIPEGGHPWGMHERWVLQSDGRFRARIPFEFIGLDDKAISHPKLDTDSESFATNWGRKPPAALTIPELKLPAALFQ